MSRLANILVICAILLFSCGLNAKLLKKSSSNAAKNTCSGTLCGWRLCCPKGTSCGTDRFGDPECILKN